MKKVLLTAFTGFLAYSAIGQACTPDPNYTPTSAIGAGISDLPCAVVNVAYDESATIVIPPTVEFNGTDVYVCKVTVTSIDNLPASVSPVNPAIWYNGASYGFGQEITLLSNVDRGCVKVAGTFTALYDDSLYVQGSIKAGFAANCATTFSVPFTGFAPNGIPIAFRVKASQAACDATMGIEETISNNSFDVAQNFPNPFNGESQIAFNLPEAGKVTFRVTNLVGKTVKDVNINGNSGVNYLNISSADYAAGVYMYSISFGGKTLTKRMIIK